MRVMRAFGSALLAGALLTGAAGCGGGGSDGPEELEFGTEQGDLNPEDVRASDTEVAAGFTELSAVIAMVAANLPADEAAAADAQEKILPIWESILGTVKANDPASFDTLSRAFAYLISAPKDTPPATLAAAVAAFRTTSTSYLRLHPAGSASPGPQADTESDAGDESAPADDGAPAGY